MLSAGLTAADLEAVTAVTAPAFRKLWEAGSRVEPEASAAVSVGGSTGESPLSLRIFEPYMVPGTSATRRPAQPRRRPPAERAPARPERTRPPAERAPARPGRTGLTIAVAVACVLAVLAAWFLFFRSSEPIRTEKATVRELCSDLSSGNVSGAYQLFSDTYQNATSQQAVQASLLGTSATARCTVGPITGDHAVVSLLRPDGTVRTLTLSLRPQAGQWQITSMTVSP